MKLKWNLNELFNDNDECFDNIKRVKAMTEDIQQYRNKTLDANTLKKLLDGSFEIKDKSYRSLVYGSLRYYQNVKDEKNIELKQAVEKSNNETLEALSFIEEAILNCGKEAIFKMIEENPDLEQYRLYLDNIFRLGKHSVQDAQITMLKNEINDYINRYLEIMKTVAFDSIIVDGKECEITSSNAAKYLMANDRETRRQAFLSINNGYKSKEREFVFILNEIIKRRIQISRLRGYNNPMEEAFDEENIDVRVLEELFKTVNSNKNKLKKYMSIQASFNKINDPHLYDLGRPFVIGSSKTFSLNDGIEILKEALGILGNKYLGIAFSLLQSGHIDAELNGDKHPTMTFSWLSYSFLNYKDSYNDLKNLVHELGHSINDYLSCGLPFPYRISSVFVGETASIVNEILLCNHLVNSSENNEDKVFYLGKKIDNYVTSVFRQTMYSEFEKKVYERVLEEKDLTGEYLGDTYLNILKSYYGEDIVYDEESRYEWMRLSHLFRWAFYPYKYATGLLIASTVYSNIVDGSLNIEDYLNFLSSGSANYSLELLKLLNIDVEKDEVFNKGFEDLEKNLKLLESIIFNEDFIKIMEKKE